LTPASGRQDHTTSPYAATSLVRSLGDRSQAFRQPALQSHRAQNAAASTASAPRVRDDRDTPLCGVGWRGFVEMICPTGEAKYFCKGDWTLICPTGCLRVTALPASAIDLHLQSVDIDFIAAKTRSAVASGNGARTGIDQIVASDPRAMTLRQTI
jgi:hypothetical protein